MIRLIIILLVYITALTAGDKPMEWHWKSQTEKLQAEAKFVEPDKPRIIYVSDPSVPGVKVQLCTFERDAELLFSPDDSWIALNDLEGSGLAEIRLFKRIEGLRYSESKIHPHEKCWALLRRAHKVRYPAGLFHQYAFVKQWSTDSSAVLINLSGHSDINHFVEEWLCVFDLKTGQASFDLSKMNRKSVKFVAGGLTLRSSRTPPALPSALSHHFTIAAPLIASVQARPLSFIR